jgi:hypothetical protein
MMALLLGAAHQLVANPKIPLSVPVRLHLIFHAFFESVQGGGPALLPDLAGLIRKLRERRLACPHLPPVMQQLLGGAEAPAAPGSSTPQGGSSPRGSSAAVNSSPVARLQIGPGRNLGACIRTAVGGRRRHSPHG